MVGDQAHLIAIRQLNDQLGTGVGLKYSGRAC